MIARMWRGVVRTEKLAEYVDIVERTGMAGYRRTPGNQGAQLLTRDLGEGRSEVITLSWWADLDHIKAFAGDDIELAKVLPGGRRVPPRPGDHRRAFRGGATDVVARTCIITLDPRGHPQDRQLDLRQPGARSLRWQVVIFTADSLEE
jgi:heme-degrading monooxygenase HmoA